MAGQIITVSQQKGGSGKTTLAAHLAVALTQAGGGPVALLDIDPQGSLGQWFETRERRLGTDRTGLVFRTASGWGARREARSLARDHSFVLVDTPPKSDLESKPAIEAADLIAVPIQPTHVDLWATESTLRVVAKEGSRSLLVFNRVPARAALSDQVLAAIRDIGCPVAETRLGNRVAFASSMGQGSTVLESEPQGRGAEEVRRLCAELLGHLG